ncbi:unnamed protein product (macronuclear) [Paramecium tetraurelia]|uniref:ELMO domain-containing protein n=1 Tax=Paramecium tetraurelia TaxID=5888 RepID=A0DRE0_PARTE|nr:uncharacterized protein GSPATT00019324001 [Paramecium tetraurelia]CAK85607.1 unnamed protein product [Paramecium tetraurelia]|eukprot:XP_001453004.1 hypothetical protein (macronuclear) [Paramecium tetraurelia strain d4-2]
MFFVHETPEIIDNVQFIKLKNKEGLAQEDQQFLQDLEKSRSEVKYILTHQNIKTLVENRVSLLTKKDALDNYLKTNVDMMRLYLIKIKEHPKFSYKLTINKKQQQYKTESINTAEEACGCEIVMVRYMYLLGFNNSATPHVLRLRYSMLSTPNNIDLNDIQEGLKVVSTGWMPFQRLCNVMDDLLHFLVTKQQQLIPELKMTTIFSFKLLIECNMNFFYLETFRLQKQYESMVRVCKSSYTKLIDAHNRLSQIKDEIHPEILEYCLSGQKYFKVYGIWSILLKNESDILFDRTKNKSYTILTAECHKIANQIVQIAQEISSIKNINEYDKFTLGFIQNVVNPTLQKSLSVYSQSAKQPCQLPDQLLVQAESLDYTDQLKQ